MIFNKKMKKPTVINLPITEICDSQCIMCNVWRAGKVDEFKIDDIKNIFSQSLFDQVKHIGLSGGEPSLNDELVGICEQLVLVLPRLKTLSITSHGFHTERLSVLLPKINKICMQKNIRFSLNLSVDGYKEVHDKVRRIANGFDRVIASAEVAKSFGIHVQLQCTISPLNVYNVVSLREFALENNYEIIFRIATFIARLSNGDLKERIKLSFKEKSFIADFLESPKTILAAKSLGRRLFYYDLAYRLRTDDNRKAPCAFQSNALYISPDKKIYNCSRSEQELQINDINKIQKEAFNETNNKILENLIEDTCPSCYHDQSGRWPLYKYFQVHNRFFHSNQYFNKLRKLLGQILLIPGLNSYHKNEISKTLKTVLIIGCYGGEHVGDAAILGGVIKRFIDNYKTEDFVVISIRPDRTQTWVDNLQIPNVNISVISNQEKINVERYNSLVLAGGPLMGIISLLLNHIKYIKKFKKLGKPFIIESIGLGPYNGSLSKKLIAKILGHADKLSVRTNNAFEKAKEFNPQSLIEVFQDPAFDYIEQQNNMKILPHHSLERLLDTDKKIIIINLRPLWSKYSQLSIDLEKIEARIIDSFVQMMALFNKNFKFIFMPMNADQYGFSDLEMAYKLEKQIANLNDKIDFSIWEFEPTINDTVYLLKKAKACISMRFHGCIFSLANNIPTIGIDYSMGSNGKIYELFKDRNLLENVIKVMELNEEILCNKLSEVLPNE